MKASFPHMSSLLKIYFTASKKKHFHKIYFKNNLYFIIEHLKTIF